MSSGEVGGDTIAVGRFEIPLHRACEWVASYTDAANNQASKRPFAYPAYDRYSAGSDAPDVLSDGDLLAPMLLNVGIKIRSFYALQAVRSELQEALAAPELEQPLAELDADTVAARVGALYAVLDDPERKPWGINATSLSKILHRKRPNSVVLHDKWVRECYLGTGHLPRVKDRTWSAYMIGVSLGIQDDIVRQPTSMDAVRHASLASPRLSDVRLMDILAWHIGQGRPA